MSVIIPIYNVERYLVQCVESVLAQTIRNIEVILVDDGSPDACPQIADDFAARDLRVTVIHQENQGLSGARNAGLHRATGRLVVFLDSDDYWEGERSLEICVQAFDERPELDVLFFDAMRYYEATDERVFGDVEWDRDRVAGTSETEILRYMVECGDVRPSACTKLIRRQFLIDHELDFKLGIFSEDVEWFLRLITCRATFDYIPLPFYMYRKNRSGSITDNIGAENVRHVVDTVLEASRRVLDSGRPQDYVRDYLSYCCYQYTIALAFYGGLDRAVRRQVRPVVREGRFLLPFDTYRNGRTIGLLARIIGLEATARLLHAFLALRAHRNRGR
ncbi:glycosyltransferase family 2 protein [Aestuariimicrobium sp. Y1814]|uniref:glycosyltransferase family 2 protein n=1 Tax=Aestuariimicrobium sp. Y1814 TaxID=3418742 RepID=UPI003DA770EF